MKGVGHVPSRMRLTPAEEAALRARRQVVAREHRMRTEALLDAADDAERAVAAGQVTDRAAASLLVRAVADRDEARSHAALDVLPQVTADWLDGPARAEAAELCVRAGVIDVRLVG